MEDSAEAVAAGVFTGAATVGSAVSVERDFVCVVDGLSVARFAPGFSQLAECLHRVSSLATGWDLGADSR